MKTLEEQLVFAQDKITAKDEQIADTQNKVVSIISKLNARQMELRDPSHVSLHTKDLRQLREMMQDRVKASEDSNPEAAAVAQECIDRIARILKRQDGFGGDCMNEAEKLVSAVVS